MESGKRLPRYAVAALVTVAFLGALFYSAARVQSKPSAEAKVENEALVRPGAPVLGAEQAPVTLVEFFDPACEACRAFYPVVKRALSDFGGKLRVVLRYTPFHDSSEKAVRILETARMQGVFEPVLAALMKSQPRWAAHDGPDMAAAWDAARGAGLDVEEARSQMRHPGITAIINRDRADLRTLGIRSTPTFFLDGQRLDLNNRQDLYDRIRNAVANVDVARPDEDSAE